MSKRIVFLHGGPGYGEYLERFFADSLSSYFSCVFYEQLRKLPITIDDLIIQVLQKMGTDNGDVYLVGHSWGGVLAIETYKRTRDPRVKGIVLISSFLCAADSTTEYEKELASLNIQNPRIEQIFFTPEELQVSSEFVKHLDASFDENICNQIERNFLDDYDAREFVKTISVPVLNIFGERDIRIPSRRQRTYAQLNNRIQNFEVKGAGHFPFLLPEHCIEVVSAIRRFVEA